MFQHQLLPRLELECKTINGGHYYITPAGRYPSVTTVIDNLKDKTYLKLWRERIGDAAADKIVQESRKHGNKIHSLCEEYLLNIIPSFFMEPALAEAKEFHQIRSLLDNNVEIVYGVELNVWSPLLKTAGTTDAVVKWQGENTILDFKTSRKPIDRGSEKIRLYKLQTVIYSIMVEEQYNMEVPYSCIIIIVKDKPAPVGLRFKNKPYKEAARKIFLNRLTSG